MNIMYKKVAGKNLQMTVRILQFKTIKKKNKAKSFEVKRSCQVTDDIEILKKDKSKNV